MKLKIFYLLIFLITSTVCAKGLYEVVFINTTDQAFKYSIDLLWDIEKGIFKTGGDVRGTIKPMDSKTGAPSVTEDRTRLAYEIKSVTIYSKDGKKKMKYNIPSKAGKDLRGKDWVFEITKEGTRIKICRKWSHTKLQDQMTIAAEVIAIIAGAIVIGGGIGAAAAKVAGEAKAAEAATAAAAAATEAAMAESAAAGTAGVTESAAAEAALLLEAEAAADEALTAMLFEGAAAETLTSAVTQAAALGATIAAGVTVVSAAVLGALEIAAQETEGAFSSAWKEVKQVFSKAFGLSRKLHKAGCSYLK